MMVNAKLAVLSSYCTETSKQGDAFHGTLNGGTLKRTDVSVSNKLAEEFCGMTSDACARACARGSPPCRQTVTRSQRHDSVFRECWIWNGVTTPRNMRGRILRSGVIFLSAATKLHRNSRELHPRSCWSARSGLWAMKLHHGVWHCSDSRFSNGSWQTTIVSVQYWYVCLWALTGCQLFS